MPKGLKSDGFSKYCNQDYIVVKALEDGVNIMV